MASVANTGAGLQWPPPAWAVAPWSSSAPRRASAPELRCWCCRRSSTTARPGLFRVTLEYRPTSASPAPRRRTRISHSAALSATTREAGFSSEMLRPSMSVASICAEGAHESARMSAMIRTAQLVHNTPPLNYACKWAIKKPPYAGGRITIHLSLIPRSIQRRNRFPGLVSILLGRLPALGRGTSSFRRLHGYRDSPTSHPRSLDRLALVRLR